MAYISKCTIEERVSKKEDHKHYFVLVQEFENGYKMESFLNSEKVFCITTNNKER